MSLSESLLAVASFVGTVEGALTIVAVSVCTLVYVVYLTLMDDDFDESQSEAQRRSVSVSNFSSCLNRLLDDELCNSKIYKTAFFPGI